jgi:uncharacterized protein YggE
MKFVHFVVACGVATLSSVGSIAMAHGNAGDRPPTISVSASGSVDVAPDMALLTMTVRREAKTARAALDSNNAAMAGVQQAMQALGVAKRDLQTSGFSIRPLMSRPNRNQPDRTPKVIGYAVQNTLSMRVRDLTAVGSLLDKAVTLGVNQGGQIQFTNDNPQAAISEARTKAMQAAIAKANTLVSAAGVGLGKILTISETSRAPRPMPMARGRVAAMAESGAVPVQAGENSYSVSVNVSWLLRQ